MILQLSLSSQIFGLVNVNHKYRTFEANYYTFDTGWNFVQYMINNIVYIILLLFTKFGDIIIDTATQMHVLANTACPTAWNLLPEWNSTPPRHLRVKKQ